MMVANFGYIILSFGLGLLLMLILIACNGQLLVKCDGQSICQNCLNKPNHAGNFCRICGTMLRGTNV